MSQGSTLHFGDSIWHVDNLYLIIPIILFAFVLIFPTVRKKVSQNSKATTTTRWRMTMPLALGVFAMFLIQSFHMVEHFAQVFQKFALAIRPAHGLIGSLDLEWVHVEYNTAVMIPMVAVFLYAGFLRRGSWTWKKPWIVYVFTAGVLIQGYHIIEHLVKIVQHIQTGIQGTPGILGPFFDLAILHYYLNIFQYLPITFVFFGYGFHTWVFAYVRGRNPPGSNSELVTPQIPIASVRFETATTDKET